METSAIINIIGLSFDILGVILLFFYEPPKPEIDAILLESAPSLEDREKVRDIKKKNIMFSALLNNNWFYSSNDINLFYYP